MGDHLLQRTGRTGLGGTGSPAQGVFGVSFYHVALGPLPWNPQACPLLGRGPLTSVMSSLRGPLYPHTWTPATKTPHWSLLGFAPGLLRSGLEGERVGGWASCAALCCARLCCALLCCGVCCDVLCAVLC